MHQNTDQTLKLEQRAWLAPDPTIPPANFIQKIAADTELAVQFVNVGKEPALETNEIVFVNPCEWAEIRNGNTVDTCWRQAMGKPNCKDFPLNPSCAIHNEAN
jgi:hypothetical protein